jgi:hypothetical protein
VHDAGGHENSTRGISPAFAIEQQLKLVAATHFEGEMIAQSVFGENQN